MVGLKDRKRLEPEQTSLRGAQGVGVTRWESISQCWSCGWALAFSSLCSSGSLKQQMLPNPVVPVHAHGLLPSHCLI